MRSLASSLTTAALVVVLAAPLTAQRVWTVGAPGGDFQEIQSAVRSPQVRPGDVVRMLGRYNLPQEGFVLDKGLTIRGPARFAGNHAYRSSYRTTIRVPPGQVAHLVDLTFVPGGVVGGGSACAVEIAGGRVSMESCSIQAGGYTPGLTVRDADVFVVDCSLRAGGGRVGLEQKGGRVSVVQTTVIGGDSYCLGRNSCQAPVGAGAGLVVEAGTLHAAFAVVRAGTNRWGHIPTAEDGVTVRDAAVWLTDCTVAGGAHAAGGPGGTGIHVVGRAAQVARGSVTPGSGAPPGRRSVGPVNFAARQLGVRASALTRGAEMQVSLFTPAPHDPVALLAAAGAPTPTATPLIAQPSWLLGATGRIVLAAGVADAAARFAFTGRLPNDPRLEHRSLWLQAFAGKSLPVEAAPAFGRVVR